LLKALKLASFARSARGAATEKISGCPEIFFRGRRGIFFE